MQFVLFISWIFQEHSFCGVEIATISNLRNGAAVNTRISTFDVSMESLSRFQGNSFNRVPVTSKLDSLPFEMRVFKELMSNLDNI